MAQIRVPLPPGDAGDGGKVKDPVAALHPVGQDDRVANILDRPVGGGARDVILHDFMATRAQGRRQFGTDKAAAARNENAHGSGDPLRRRRAAGAAGAVAA